MDLSKKTKEAAVNKKKITGWKCTINGIHWVQSDEKKCRYCLPVYDDNIFSSTKK